MRALWINYGVPRVVSARFNGNTACVQGSWIDRLAKSIAQTHIDLQLIVLCISNEKFDVDIDGVRYLSVGGAVYGLLKGGSVRTGAEEKIRLKIREISPDIIHIHGTEHVGGDLNNDVYCGIPVVVSIQGVISQCWQAYLGGLSINELRVADRNLRRYLKWTTIFEEQEWWRVDRSGIEQRIFRRFKYFIGRTEWDRQCLAFYNPSAKYYVGNESLHEVFAQTAWNRANIRRHSIYCGNALGYGLKGGHWLIRAVAELKNEFPDIQVRIAAAQRRLPAHQSLRQWLKRDTYSRYVQRLIQSLDCADNIVALPALSPESVADELSKAEVFVLPSVCENSPNSLCEAMLVGTPSIATFTGGIPSIMQDGVEGHLVPVCDAHALAGAIRRHFRDHAYAESCIIAAKEKARSRHDEVNNARVLLGIYAQILREERRA